MNERYVLLIEEQSCIYDPSEEFEFQVDIAFATELHSYPSFAEAETAALKLLGTACAEPTYSDVRPTEECAICGRDFNTRDRHPTVVITQETGPQDNPEILDCWYVARVCAGCAPAFRAATEASWR